MTIAIQSQISNPITGVFGTGQVQIFSTSGVWTVPPGIGKVRVRLWGAGGSFCNTSTNYGGGGGGASSSSAGNPGLPGGGSGCSNQGFVVNGTTVYGAPGLVIVEW